MNALLFIVLVSGASMAPTLEDGGTYLCSSEVDTLARGDMVVFNRGRGHAIKRIAAIPGDTLSRLGLPMPSWSTATLVPPGKYYVRPDNPSARAGSQHFGLIGRSDIIGRLLGRAPPRTPHRLED